MPDAFLSYSRRDAAHAEWLRRGLREAGLDVWVDTDGRIPPGERWSDVLQQAIEESGCLVVLVSPDSLSSRVVGMEVEHARRHGKPVVPLILALPLDVAGDEAGPIDFESLPFWLEERQIIDARREPRAEALDPLIAAVRRDHHWRARHGDLMARARRWEESAGSLLSERDLTTALEWLKSVPAESARPTELQRSYVRASAAASEQRRSDRANRLADLVLSGFYDPDLAIPLAAANIEANAASGRAVLALDRAVRTSRSLGAIGPPGDVCVLRFLEKGEHLLIGYEPAGAVVVRTRDGELVASWEGNGSLRAVSAKGQLVVQDGGAIVRVDPAAGPALRLDYYLAWGLAAADFDRTGDELLTVDTQGHAWLWDMRRGKPVQELVRADPEQKKNASGRKGLGRLPSRRRRPQIEEGGRVRPRPFRATASDPITAALTDDARYAAVGRNFRVEGYSEVTVHDTRDGRQVRQQQFDWAVTSLRFRSGTHDLLFVQGGEGFLQPQPRGAPLRLAGSLREIDAGLVGSLDGRFAAAVGLDGFVRVLDLETRDEIRRLGGHDHGADVGPAFSPQGLLATGCVHGAARLWDLRHDGECQRIDVRDAAMHEAQVIHDRGHRPLVHVGVSPDGSRLCATAEPLVAAVWECDGLKGPHELHPAPAAGANQVAWLPDGSLLGIPGRRSGCLDRYRATKDGYESEPLLPASSAPEDEDECDDLAPESDTPRYRSLIVSADGSRLALQVATTWEAWAEVWSIDPPERLAVHAEGRLMAMSGDGRVLLSKGEDGAAIWWSPDAGRQADGPSVDLGECHLAAAAPTGRRFGLACGSSITVLESGSENASVEIVGHRARVLAMAFSPGGERLASGAQDGALRVWNARTGAELRRLDLGDGNAVTAVCFTPDGRCVVSGSADGQVRFWRLWDVEELLGIARERGGELGEADRRRHGLQG